MTGIPVVNVNNNCSTGSRRRCTWVLRTIRGNPADCDAGAGASRGHSRIAGQRGPDHRSHRWRRHILALNEDRPHPHSSMAQMDVQRNELAMKKLRFPAEHFIKIGFRI